VCYYAYITIEERTNAAMNRSMMSSMAPRTSSSLSLSQVAIMRMPHISWSNETCAARSVVVCVVVFFWLVVSLICDLYSPGKELFSIFNRGQRRAESGWVCSCLGQCQPARSCSKLAGSAQSPNASSAHSGLPFQGPSLCQPL